MGKQCRALGCRAPAEFAAFAYAVDRGNLRLDVTFELDRQSPFLCNEHAFEDGRFDGPHYTGARPGRALTIYVPLPDEENRIEPHVLARLRDQLLMQEAQASAELARDPVVANRARKGKP